MNFFTKSLFILMFIFASAFADGSHGDHSHDTAPSTSDQTKSETHGEQADVGIGHKLVHNLEHHLVDSDHMEIFGKEIHLPTISIGSWELHITKHRVWWLIAMLTVFVLAFRAARQKSVVPSGLRNVFEMLAVWLRDDIVKPNLHEKTDKFLPYFMTLFTCVLFSNLMGLLPWGASSTGNINVTAGLSICTLGLMVGMGIKENGIGGFLHTFAPPGVPGWLLPLIIIIEIVSFLIRPFALTIRLFANMLAGHAVIAVLLGLIISLWFATPSIAVSTGVMILEIIVALIQSYIFCMLTAVYIGLAINPH